MIASGDPPAWRWKFHGKSFGGSVDRPPSEGENIGASFSFKATERIKEIPYDIWLVSFMDYDLGYFDLETRVLEPLDNPSGPRLSPM